MEDRARLRERQITMFKVAIWLKETSQPITRSAKAAYEKGSFYCIYDGNLVEKWPTANIFRVIEEYHDDKDTIT